VEIPPLHPHSNNNFRLDFNGVSPESRLSQTQTDVLKSFLIEPLDKDSNFDNAISSPQWIIGAGQKISWEFCAVSVYENGNREKPTTIHPVCSGKGTVERGIEVWLTGRRGKINT
jgi:hypothetical protein